MPPDALVGRDAEVRQLLGLVGDTASGHGRSVLIEGEPGIGKSRLLEVVAAESERLGMRVLRGAAEEMERKLPFAAISSCLAGSGGSASPIATMVIDGDGAPPPDVASGNEHEFTVAEAILDLVEQWCAAGPVALLLDDLQWADPASLLVLHRLGRAIGQLPLLVVAACRPMPREEGLERLLRSLDARGAITIPLGPLDSASVAELVQELAGARPGWDLMELVAGAAGNPLYVTELVAALSRDGCIRVAGGAAELDGSVAAERGVGQIPQSLPGAIIRRLDFLSREAREVLQVAAVLGPALDLTELSVILDRPASTLLTVVGEAVAGGLLTDSGDQLVFRHEVIREALAENVPQAVRPALHLQAGRALAASGARVERVAYYLLASNTVDAAMLDWLEGAVDSLITRAPAYAVDLLLRAVSHVDSGDGKGQPLRFQLTRALLWAGRPGEAESTARIAMALDPDPHRQGALRWLLARACFQQGHLHDAETVATEALASGSLTTADLARFEHFASQCRFTRGHLDVVSEEATALAMLARGDQDSTAYGLYHLCGVRYMQGRMAESLELIEQATAAFGTQDAQPEWDLAIHLMRAFLLVELDRPADAEKAFETGRREAERLGSIYLTWYPLGKARLHFIDGRWDDALAEVRAGQDAQDGLGSDRGMHTGLGLRSQATLIAIHRGGTAVITDPPYVPVGAFFDYLVRWTEGLAWEAGGHPDKALAVLLEFWEHTEGARQQRGLHYLGPDIARLAVSQGQAAQATHIADDMAELAEQQPTPTMRGLASLCRGMADADADLLLAAADILGGVGRPLYQAYAQEGAAVVLANSGRTAQARVALASALELYDGLDAAWDSARAKARLREAGVRSRRQGSGSRAKTGWLALTDTERTVASLVAEGHSNPDIAKRLFISRRTVQSHVSSILAKLNCTSRVELAVTAASERRTHE
ncbi:MAG TPA: AAA family ATPase [Pilimelia sp.]|nr:AAA family ATPase [Pilimelia sp.]